MSSTQPIARAASAPVTTLPTVAASLVAMPAVPSGAAMDADFIARNQIVERYLSGRLPARGAQDFERFCREHPEMLDNIGLADRVNAGLRLLDASGKPEPWAQTPRKPWEKLPVVAGLGAAAVALLITALVLGSRLADRSSRIEQLQKRVAERPLEPATTTRPIRIIPSRTAPSLRPVASIGGRNTEFADFRIDVSWSRFTAFRVTVDRVDQGRVLLLHNVLKDSNGDLRVALNSSALGPGTYQLTLEGLTWRGDVVPEAWTTIAVAH
jgi:hypothetical protein